MTRECVIFLVGEGRSDIGDLATSVQHRPKTQTEGFVQPLLRKLAGTHVKLAFRGQVLRSFSSKSITEPRDVLGRKSRQALALAASEGASALVLVTDVDKSQGERASPSEARRRMGEVRQALESGFAAARTVNRELVEFPAIIATPLRMIEAWALSDAAAIALATGQKSPPSLPGGTPETYWGDEENPASNHPKCVLKRACAQEPTSGTFGEIARQTRIESLETRCPESFVPFAQEVRAALARCAARVGTAPQEHRGKP